MSLLALGLVLAAAVLHASWNLFAKRAGTAGPAFVWLVACWSSFLYAPVAIAAIAIGRPRLGMTELAFLLGTAVLHIAYFVSLQEGYRTGELGVVYPLARGTGPLIATAAAIGILGERPSVLAVAGGLSVCGGVIVLGLRGRGDARGVGFGLLTGALIACYTLWDNHAVTVLAIPPLVYDWAANVGRALLMAPMGARDPGRVRRIWVLHRREVLVVAAISPLAYILVLTALSFTAVSYIAPAREVSILIGTLLGARFLAEDHTRLRTVAAAAIVAGVIALAVG